VADYTPALVADRKLSKQDAPLDHIALVRTGDILAELCAQRPARLIVGFAAETHDVVARGVAKRARKGADLLLANVVGEAGCGFDDAASQGALIHDDGTVEEFGPVSKHQVARLLVDRMAKRLASPREVHAGDPR